MALPYCVAHARPARLAEIAEIAGIVCGAADPEQLVHWLTTMNAAMDIPPSLEAVGIAEEALPEMVRECIELYPRPNSPVPIEPDGLHQLLGHFLTGDAIAAWHEADRYGART